MAQRSSSTPYLVMLIALLCIVGLTQMGETIAAWYRDLADAF